MSELKLKNPDLETIRKIGLNNINEFTNFLLENTQIDRKTAIMLFKCYCQVTLQGALKNADKARSENSLLGSIVIHQLLGGLKKRPNF